MELRPMTCDDLDDVATVHVSAFPDFFLTLLGAHFLRVFYGAVVKDRTALATVATLEGRIVGFVVGTTKPRSFYRRLLIRRFFAVAVSLLPTLVGRPGTLLRVARRVVSRTVAEPSLPGAELMSIAVSPNTQGLGVGARLVDAFCSSVKGVGLSSLWLTTDAVDNDAVRRFYEDNGFAKEREFQSAEGRKLVEYVRLV